MKFVQKSGRLQFSPRASTNGEHFAETKVIRRIGNMILLFTLFINYSILIFFQHFSARCGELLAAASTLSTQERSLQAQSIMAGL